MHNFRVVCFLSVTFCLVVCVCANAAVKEADATAAVNNAQDTVKTVRGRAQSQLVSAKGLLAKVESSKEDAAQAYSQAKQAATGNTKAKDIANTIKSLSEAVGNMYQDPKEKLENAVKSLTPLLAEAQRLEGESNIEIPANTVPDQDYTETSKKATTLKAQADALNDRITDALALFEGVGAIANEMAEKAKEAQLKDSHVSAIVAVAKIESMLRTADTTIQQIEGKKNAVNGIVDEMKRLNINPPVVPDENINALMESAAGALTAAKSAVQNAKDAKAEIQTQKGLADNALTKFKAENQEVSDAQRNANTADACASTAEKIVQQLGTALQTATNSVTSAKDLKERLQTALSTATSVTRTEQGVTNPEVKALQDSVSADVKTIQTMMQEAEGTLQKTQNHKEEVNNIVEEMKKHCTTDLIESYEIIKEQCQSANDALTSATGAVEKAKSAKGEIEKQKGLADTALANVQKPETDVTQAEKEDKAAKKCVTAVEQKLEEINNALQTVKASLTNANNLKPQLETALSTTTTAPSTVQATETAKANPPVEQGTEPHQKDATIQPTSEELPSQSDNSTAKLKDALIKGAQNVPTTALTGGKAPALGANNDSAMTVSVPLLVALIASAVLQ